MGCGEHRLDDYRGRFAGYFCPTVLGYGLVGLLLLMITIEAAFKRQLANLVRWIAIILAVFSLMVLVVQFFWYIILAGVVITGCI